MAYPNSQTFSIGETVNMLYELHVNMKAKRNRPVFVAALTHIT